MWIIAILLVAAGVIAFKVIVSRKRKARYAAIADPIERDRARYRDEMRDYEIKVKAWQHERQIAQARGVESPIFNNPPKPPRMPASLING